MITGLISSLLFEHMRIPGALEIRCVLCISKHSGLDADIPLTKTRESWATVKPPILAWLAPVRRVDAYE
jgi:hypothetical protein